MENCPIFMKFWQVESVEETFLMMENVDIMFVKDTITSVTYSEILFKNSHSQLILSEYCQISRDHSNARLIHILYFISERINPNFTTELR